MIKELETLAIKAVALKDPEYFTRRVIRYYSEKFHTPLMEVYDLPWAFVLTNYLEHIIETSNSKEDIYNLSVDICYPELRQIEEDVIENRIRELEIENMQRGNGRKPKPKAPQEVEAPKEEENPHIEEPEINMGEGSFSHLEDEMEDGDE